MDFHETNICYYFTPNSSSVALLHNSRLRVTDHSNLHSVKKHPLPPIGPRVPVHGPTTAFVSITAKPRNRWCFYKGETGTSQYPIRYWDPVAWWERCQVPSYEPRSTGGSTPWGGAARGSGAQWTLRRCWDGASPHIWAMLVSAPRFCTDNRFLSGMRQLLSLLLLFFCGFILL